MVGQGGYVTLETYLPLGVDPSEQGRRLTNREAELTAALTMNYLLVTSVPVQDDYGTTIIDTLYHSPPAPTETPSSQQTRSSPKWADLVQG